MKSVNKPIKKIDSMQLVTGQPVYTEDIAPSNCLVVKLLRSPHANAIIKSINTDIAKKVSGIEAVYTYKDIPEDARRFTLLRGRLIPNQAHMTDYYLTNMFVMLEMLWQ